MFAKVQRVARIVIVLVFTISTLFFLAVAWFGFGVHNDDRQIEPRIAIWMEHAWARGTEKDYYFLKQEIEDANVTDLYFHVGPLGPNGELAEDLNIFRPGLEALDTTNFAWLGQIRSQIDLDDPEVRQGVIESAQWILDRGFDGIHLNIEPVRANDEGFFLLVEELRTTLPETSLSVAMDEWQPHWISQLVGWAIDANVESYWNSKQVRQVAQHVDQLAVMTYDTRFRDPVLYAWWVEQQTVALSKIVPADTELFIGIPAYEEGESIDPLAENVQTGLSGFIKGVSNLRSKLDNITGVAVYSYWELDKSEWSLLKSI